MPTGRQAAGRFAIRKSNMSPLRGLIICGENFSISISALTGFMILSISQILSRMKTNLLVLSIFLIAFIKPLAQGVIEPVHKPVYDFIDRMNEKGIVKVTPVLKPYTRNDIINYLTEVEEQIAALSGVEREELRWFKSEYITDNIFTDDFEEGIFNSKNRFRFYYYRDSLFGFYFTPALSYEAEFKKGNTAKTLSWGVNTFGHIDKIGFRFDFSENSLSADNLIANDNYTDDQGRIIASRKGNKIEFSRTNGSFLYQNSFLTAGAVKENIHFGSGQRSRLILSDKAPSFPSLYLKLDPVDWFQFYFMHGWLNSSIVDSSRIYTTDFDGRKRFVEKEKYFVLHAVQLNPWSNFSFTLGETIIYSDRNIYFGYFIPFLFYRSVDHAFTYGSGDSGNNGSFFGDISYRPVSGLKVYGSIFIDELALSKLLKGETDRNQFGYTIGAAGTGLIDNLSLSLEYTKILPWVYSNWIPSQTYTNSNFLMGHYIGQNADQVFIAADYRFMRGLELSAWGEYTRRGGTSDISNQYQLPGEPFLYGLKRSDLNWGINLSYEYLHDLRAELYYQYSNISDEDKLRTPDWQLGVKHSFGVGIRYGM